MDQLVREPVPSGDPAGGWAALLRDLPDLMIPGPAALHEETLAILGSPLMAHYGGGWPEIHRQVGAAVGDLLGCSDPFLLPGTGSAALDAALLNVFEPGQRVVVPLTGYFGSRIADMARAQRLEVIEVPVPVGGAVPLDRVAEALDGGAHGLVCTHVETSTGVRHPVEALAAAAAGAGAAFVVDAVASAGGETLHVDDLGADAVVTATQKGLEAPPGIGVIALSPRGRERVADRSSPCPSWYLDLPRWERHRRSDAWEPHPVTMPTTALIALLASVRRILGEGVATRTARRSELAGRCRQGLADAGLRPVADAGHQANLVVAVWADRPAELADHLVREAGIRIALGLGPTDGRAVRVGLLGRTATDAMVDRLLAALPRR